MKSVVVALGLLLVVLHHDLWFWDDGRLVAGFLPVGLFWHMLISVMAGGLWWLAACFAWPDELDGPEESK